MKPPKKKRSHLHAPLGELVAPVLPPKETGEKIAQTPLRLPASILARVDEIAEDEDYSRNEVLVHFVRWALGEYEREQLAAAQARPDPKLPQKPSKK